MKFEPRDIEAMQLCADTLARCTYPFDQVAEHVLIPVEVADLSRYTRDGIAYVRGARGGTGHPHPDGEYPDDMPGFGHLDVINDDNEHGHGIIVRQQVLGLYWLPTAKYPGGRISVERNIARDLQHEVLICEVAHAIDYTAMTVEQRDAILRAYHGGKHPHEVGHVSDWWEEEGEVDYRDWTAEAFMFGVVLAFSDMRPSFDFFTHKTTPEVVDAIRRVLTPPDPAPILIGVKCKRPKCRRVYHRPECRIARYLPLRYEPLDPADIARRRGCRICRP